MADDGALRVPSLSMPICCNAAILAPAPSHHDVEEQEDMFLVSQNVVSPLAAGLEMLTWEACRASTRAAMCAPLLTISCHPFSLCSVVIGAPPAQELSGIGRINSRSPSTHYD